VKLDFAELARAGSMLGSGAVVVVAEGTDLLGVAANVTRFFRNESCGKCVPCRLGSEKAVELLDGVRSGQLRRTALDVLPELAETMALTSICGLGQVAVAPAISLLRLHRAEA
jgi:NADH:ubiquinone oxidoreductase subunit F (NADH-binding)